MMEPDEPHSADVPGAVPPAGFLAIFRRGNVLPLLVGLLAWCVFSGYPTLSPVHFGWLLHNFDTPQHYAGWLFFQHAPWWQWPLGMNPYMGYDVPSSIVMTDSIPLLAFLFKPFAALLPASFQYFGVWILACFLLQAWFAFRLLRRFSPSMSFCLAGTFFFVTAPFFLMRIYLHPGLAGHWLILAAFDLYFSAVKRRFACWTALLVVASLVHPYLLAMVIGIWGADLLRQCGQQQIALTSLLRQAFATTVATVLVMWAAGYFVAGSTVQSDQSSRSFANLLFPFWPGAGFLPLLGRNISDWSTLLPSFAYASKGVDASGFAYFGAGFLLLAVCALALLWRKRNPEVASLPWAFVALACVGMLLYSLGNDWYVGRRLLLHLPQFTWLNHVQSIFRFASRFLWPAWYLSLLACLYLVATRLPRRVAAALMCLCLVVQSWDFRRLPGEFHQAMIAAGKWKSPMGSDIWPELARHYRKIAVVGGYKPGGFVLFDPRYRVVVDFASRNDIAISAGWLAHVDNAQLEAADAQRITRLRDLRYEGDTFYVVLDQAAWRLARCQYRLDAWVGTIDGIDLVVPDGVNLPTLERWPHAACVPSPDMGAR